ncbi:MAG: DUF4445 domain-containing protein [Deltaproteobacteria bacterium]|nr:DUF4445 domain-containing protein [Deltaproteobacteria bacterium]
MNKTFPLATKFFLELPSPSLQDNTADLDRVVRQLKALTGWETFRIPFDRIPGWVRQIRTARYRVTASVALTPPCARLLDLEPGDTTEKCYGLAVDLGTTRIACQIWDLKSRAPVFETDFENPQTRFGPDILTRIQMAEKPEGLQTLQEAVIRELNRIIREFAASRSLAAENMLALVLAGNTTMIHLFLGLDPYALRREPYIPVVNTLEPLSARELGLTLHPRGPVYIFPNVGSYLGGDILAGIQFSRLNRQESLSLLVDVGTNAEVVLGNSQWLLGCAGAAGPALEGGVAAMGMTAGPGAIEQVRIDPRTREIRFRQIGGGRPAGICGSGLIDLVAEMFLAGLIDIRGKFNGKVKTDRWVEIDGQPAYLLVPADETQNGRPIVFTQIDLDILLRSKAAMYTILTTLVQSVGHGLDEVEQFFIAGAFGNHIDPEKAITIGLLPDLPRERFVPLGNASLQGAAELLLDYRKQEEVRRIAGTITYLEMNVNQDFMNRFSAARFLPHTDLSLFPSVPRPL